MDCGLVVAADGPSVRTVPMHRIRVGDRVVVGHDGVRVHPPERPATVARFEFMNSEVVVREAQGAARRRRSPTACGRPRERGGRVLAVCGPAVIHTGGGPAIARLVARRLDRRAVRRQRLRHPRHGVERPRHVARRLGDVGPRHRGRPLEPPAPHQRGPAPRLDRRRRRRRVRRRRRDVRVRAARRAVRARRVGARRRPAARHDRRRRRRRRHDARPRRPASRVALMLASTLHAIATGNILPGRRRDVLRRHQPGGRHQARRPRQPPGPRHRHRRRPLPATTCPKPCSPDSSTPDCGYRPAPIWRR